MFNKGVNFHPGYHDNHDNSTETSFLEWSRDIEGLPRDQPGCLSSSVPIKDAWKGFPKQNEYTVECLGWHIERP